MAKIRDIGPRKWWALGAISLAAIAFSLDLTVLNLALPTLANDLHATTDQLQWIADSYALVLAVLTLPAGLLGDRYGRKKLLLFALLVFGSASLWCAYSKSVNELISARLLLGVGAAFILPLAMSAVPVYFTAAERTKALAVLMGGVFLAYPLGPILGGWLLTHFWWGSVFLINVPVVLIAFVATAILLPENRGTSTKRIDFGGIALSSLGLTGVTYGAIQAESNGWHNHTVEASLIAGVLLLICFALYERSVMRAGRQPLVDMELFKFPSFTWGTLLMTSVNFALFGLLFGLPQYLEAVRGDDPLKAGYYLLPMIVGLMFGSVAAGKFGSRVPVRFGVSAGFAVMAAGLYLGTHTSVSSPGSFIIIWGGTIGLGLGLAMPSVATAALSALSPDRSAAGTACVSAVRQVGGTLGIALLGTLLGASYRNHLTLVGFPASLATTVRSNVTVGMAVATKLHSPMLMGLVRSAFVYGLDRMLLLCSGIAITAAVLALLLLPTHVKERVAAASTGRKRSRSPKARTLRA